jgi:hypothetical protein
VRTLAAVALLAALAGAASAERALVADGGTTWVLELPAGYAREDPPPSVPDGSLLASFAAPGGRRVLVQRVRANTDGAHDGDAGYFAGLEEGVRNEAQGYRRISGTSRKLGRSGKIPAYDLWYRSGEALRGTRFVLRSGYALIVTVHAPRTRRPDRALKAIVEKFVPAG